MDVTVLKTDNYNCCMEIQHPPRNRASLIKSTDMNNGEIWDKDLITKKELGGHLNIGEEKFVEMIERVAKALVSPRIEMQFFIHEKTREVSVKIINAENKEVIREIPSKELLNISAKIYELKGIFADKKI